MEEVKAKRILFGSSSAREEDMISNLPDSLISQILLYLPTKEVVRTSVLSNRWKSLWLLNSVLDLDSNEFADYNAFASFVDRCLDFSRDDKSCVHKLKLSIRKDENDQSCVTRWIDFVATAPKLMHLDVECFVMRECLEVMPTSLFICETLLYLRLCKVLFGSFEELSSVSLPRLKTMLLEQNVYANETSLELFISSCPVLEDLSIVRREDDNVKVLRVRSQTLTSLSIMNYFELEDDMEIIDVLELRFATYNHQEFGVLIDAPRLESLNFEDDISDTKTITSSSSLTKVNILGEFFINDSDDQVCKFFTCFSGVKDLKICGTAFSYFKDIVPLLQFCNLTSMEAELGFQYLETLQTFLVSCPNLRSLILDLFDSGVREQMRLSPMPMCLLSSLEFVEIKCSFNGDPTMELIRYFVENSVILKKLALRLSSSTLEETSGVLRNLLAFPKRSSTCQIIVC